MANTNIKAVINVRIVITSVELKSIQTIKADRGGGSTGARSRPAKAAAASGSQEATVTIGPRGDPANSEGIAWQPAHPKPPTMAALESQQLHDLSSPAEPCDFGQAAKAGDATQSTASKRAKQLNRRFTEPACKSVRLPLPQDEEEQQEVAMPDHMGSEEE